MRAGVMRRSIAPAALGKRGSSVRALVARWCYRTWGAVERCCRPQKNRTRGNASETPTNSVHSTYSQSPFIFVRPPSTKMKSQRVTTDTNTSIAKNADTLLSKSCRKNNDTFNPSVDKNRIKKLKGKTHPTIANKRKIHCTLLTDCGIVHPT